MGTARCSVGISACERSQSSILAATEVALCGGGRTTHRKGDVCKALRVNVNRGPRSVLKKFACSHKKLEGLSGKDPHRLGSLLSLQGDSTP